MSAQTNTPIVHATGRTLLGHQTKALRREGKLPAVMYGNVKENANISVNAHDFGILFKTIGFTTLVDLVIDSAKPVKALVHDVSFHPLKGDLTHVDFYVVNLKEKLTTEVPLEFTGVADAVEILGGIFLTVKDAVEIECLPDDLPQHIEVDITSLKTFDDSIRIKDLILPKRVVALAEEDEVIASVSEPISEADLAALDETATVAETEFATTSGTDATPAEDGKTE